MGRRVEDLVRSRSRGRRGGGIVECCCVAVLFNILLDTLSHTSSRPPRARRDIEMRWTKLNDTRRFETGVRSFIPTDDSPFATQQLDDTRMHVSTGQPPALRLSTLASVQTGPREHKSSARKGGGRVHP